jgi:beta-N-acetylhexosaminidase
LCLVKLSVPPYNFVRDWEKAGYNMRKMLLILLIVILSGCSSAPAPAEPAGNDNGTPPPEESQDMNDEVVETDEVKEMLAEMTLAEKVGQMIIVGFSDSVIDAGLEEMIAVNGVGGLIFFNRNIIDSNQLQALVSAVNELNRDNRLPLFIAADEEGGRVTRLPPGDTRFPSAKEMGKKNDTVLSFASGQAIGSNLISYGFNMNFAPVLDILSNPANKVIGDRAFGSEPGIVASLGVATMGGMQSMGVIPVIKHFPGHGDTAADSHYRLPVVNHDMDRLDGFELVPFKEAIKAGADAVMAAHIKYPRLDENGSPATLSQTVLTGILREKLGFTGVIITDDLEMGAITNHYSIKKAALEAVKAGADIILVCHTYARQQDALDALIEAFASGELSEQRIDESVERIIRLKLKYKLF